MSNKTIGLVLIVAGVLAVALVLLSHTLGISANEVLGWKRITLLVVGILAAAAGVVMAFFMKPKKG